MHLSKEYRGPPHPFPGDPQDFDGSDCTGDSDNSNSF